MLFDEGMEKCVSRKAQMEQRLAKQNKDLNANFIINFIFVIIVSHIKTLI